MNIRSPTSNPVLQTIELSWTVHLSSRTWALVQWVLLARNRYLKRGSLPAVRPQCTWAADSSILLMLGSRWPLSQLRRRTLKYPVPAKLADTECTSPNGMASGVTYCCHWIAAVHDYTICTIFQTLPIFFLDQFVSAIISLSSLFFFTTLFRSSLVSQPNTMKSYIPNASKKMPPEDLPLVSLQHSMNTRPRAEGNSRVKNGPVKSSDFFQNPAIGFQGV